MKRVPFVVATLIMLAMVAAVPVRGLAQVPSPPSSSAPQPATSLVSLKVTVVISRFNGEKKIASLPFVLMVIPSTGDRDGGNTSVQMGSEVPVPQTSFGTDGKQPVMSYTYRPVGTNITASARALESGLFNLSLVVNDSQVLSDTTEPSTNPLRGLARFQSFTSNTRLLVRDGQTIQYTAATDKTSGEVAKLDVTVNVVR